MFSNERYGIPDASTEFQLNRGNYYATHGGAPGGLSDYSNANLSPFGAPSYFPPGTMIGAAGGPPAHPFGSPAPGASIFGSSLGPMTTNPFGASPTAMAVGSFGVQQPTWNSVQFSAQPINPTNWSVAQVFGHHSGFAQALNSAAMTKNDLDNREMVALEIHHRRLNRIEDVVDALAQETSAVVVDHEQRLRKIEGFLSDQISRMATGRANVMSER